MLAADHGGAHAGKAVGGDAHADAAFADQNATVEISGKQFARDDDRRTRDNRLVRSYASRNRRRCTRAGRASPLTQL